MLMFGVGAVILALVQTDEWGWRDERTGLAGIAGLAREPGLEPGQVECLGRARQLAAQVHER